MSLDEGWVLLTRRDEGSDGRPRQRRSVAESVEMEVDSDRVTETGGHQPICIRMNMLTSSVDPPPTSSGPALRHIEGQLFLAGQMQSVRANLAYDVFCAAGSLLFGRPCRISCRTPVTHADTA